MHLEPRGLEESRTPLSSDSSRLRLPDYRHANRVVHALRRRRNTRNTASFILEPPETIVEPVSIGANR